MLQYPTREFSTKVTLRLEIDGHVVPLAQTGREFVIAYDVPAIPPGAGTIVMTIDGVEQRFAVYLAEGLQPQRSEHPTVMLEPSWG